MTTNKLADGITSFLTFVPSKDFELSSRFYCDLGFEVSNVAPGVAQARLGPHGFLLQDFYVKDWAENFMMHVMVANLDDWWQHIDALDLPGRFSVQPPKPPALQASGLRTTHVWDPAGVLWHFSAKMDEASDE